MITFDLALPQYLRQWLIHSTGGSVPVRFPKGSPFNSFLRVFLRNKREREAWIPASEGMLQIVVPKFPGKDPAYNNFLPAKSMKAFTDLIRDSFDAALFRDMSAFHRQCAPKMRQTLLLAWMDDHGIETDDRNFCAVNKRLQILRERAFDRERKKRRYAEKKSVTSSALC